MCYTLFLASEFAIGWIAKGGLHFHVFCSNSDAADGRNSNILILDSITVRLDLSRFSAHLLSTKMKSSFLTPHECSITLHSVHHRTFLFPVLPACFFLSFCASYFPLSEIHIDLSPMSISGSKLSFYPRTVHNDMTGSEMLNVTSFSAPPSTFVLENCSSCLYQAEAPLNDLKGKLGWHIFWGSVWFPLTRSPVATFPLQIFIFYFFCRKLKLYFRNADKTQ